MIKICLDTNAFFENWLAGGEAFTLLADLIAKNRCRVFVSEVTVLEHARQYQGDASTIESGLKSSLAKYGKLLSDKVPDIPALKDTSAFEIAFRERLKELGIEVFGIPDVPQPDLVKRDLAAKKPLPRPEKAIVTR